MTTLDREAILMLEDKGEVLETARRVTAALDSGGITGGIGGGVAVFLHGYRRTTDDVDVFTTDSVRLRGALENAGFIWNADKREFNHGDSVVPVDILTPDEVLPPCGYEVIDGVRVIHLTDLLNMKLASGTRDIRRMRDLADVVDLIQSLHLDGSLTPGLHPTVRHQSRELLKKLK